jgi:pilus assembly protein Flp/PilA
VSRKLATYPLATKHEARTKGVGAVKTLLESFMNKFLKDESGATAIEYGLIAAAMALALVTAMPSITTAITGKFAAIGTQITTGK